jgi:glycosyltransferase involved in cell wall biosynthesis
MDIAVILPTANLWGGVKRFCELGNRFVDRGHRFTMLTPNAQRPHWFAFRGDVRDLAHCTTMRYDAVFCTEAHFLPQLLACKCRLRIFYHVLQSEDLTPVLRHDEVTIFVNSSTLYRYDRRRYHIEPFKAVGGVDTKRFVPPLDADRMESDAITVLTYGRLSMKRKGTRFVVKACERLYRRGHNVRLLLFDSPIDKNDMAAAQAFRAALPFEFVLNHPVDRTQEIYARADIFASAEKNAGWANTCAEAMSCGLAVVATASGSNDFLVNNETGLVVRRNSFSLERAILRLVKDRSLRTRLGAHARTAMEVFDWDRLADEICTFIGARLAGPAPLTS